MPRRWQPEKKVQKKMDEYLKHVCSIYEDEKKSVVTSKRRIKRSCSRYDRTLVIKVIEKMEDIGVAELFTDGKNPSYKLDLEAARSYLEEISSGRE